MSTSGNDPVYPYEVKTSPYAETPATMLEGGISKREYFAAMAISGKACRQGDDYTKMAKNAVELADALVKELNEEKP